MRYIHNHTCKHIRKTNTTGKNTHTLCKLWNKRRTHNTRIHCQCVQTDSWLTQQERDWTVALFLSLCGVALLWGEAIKMGGGRGRHIWRQSHSERKVKQIDLLSWIGDLTADGPQSLEAVADGMDVGHSHKHHLAVGVVLYIWIKGKQLWWRSKDKNNAYLVRHSSIICSDHGVCIIIWLLYWWTINQAEQHFLIYTSSSHRATLAFIKSCFWPPDNGSPIFTLLRTLFWSPSSPEKHMWLFSC